MVSAVLSDGGLKDNISKIPIITDWDFSSFLKSSGRRTKLVMKNINELMRPKYNRSKTSIYNSYQWKIAIIPVLDVN
jgi:hypothetical protein